MSASPRGPIQPVFSRRGGAQVTDPNLLRRGLNSVITEPTKSAPAFDGNVGLEGGDDVLSLDPQLAKKQIKEGSVPSDTKPNAADAAPAQQLNKSQSAGALHRGGKSSPSSAVAHQDGEEVDPNDPNAKIDLGNYLDREFLESAISTYNRLAEHARNKGQYKVGIGHLRRALSLEKSGVVPPSDWPLKVLLAKTQVNVATLQYLLNQPHESLLEAALARDRSLECLNYLDSEAYSAKKGHEDPDLLFLLEESALTFCLALHSAALAMKMLPGADLAGITEVDRLAWKIGTKYLDRSHPCLSFMRKAFETRGTLTPEETAAAYENAAMQQQVGGSSSSTAPAKKTAHGAGAGAAGASASSRQYVRAAAGGGQDESGVAIATDAGDHADTTTREDPSLLPDEADPHERAQQLAQEQQDADLQDSKKRVLLQELEDLQLLLQQTAPADTAKSGGDKALAKIYDELQKVKQKAVNFELHLPEIAALEVEFLRTRRTLLHQGSGSSSNLQAPGPGAAQASGDSSGGEQKKPAKVRAQSADKKKRKAKGAADIVKVSRTPSRMDPTEFRRQKENLKHEKQLYRLLMRTATDEYLYEVRMSASKAKSRPQSAAPHSGGGCTPAAAGGTVRQKLAEQKKDVTNLMGILKNEAETMIASNPEVALSLDNSDEAIAKMQYTQGMKSMAIAQKYADVTKNPIRRISRMKTQARLARSGSAVGSPLSLGSTLSPKVKSPAGGAF